MAKKLNYIYAVGKRKNSSARVRIMKGNEENTVNTILVGKYFPGETSKSAWTRPFEELELTGKYYFTARVNGGGKVGQLAAMVQGLAKGISSIKESNRLVLKKAGLLTRDSRERERRKMNTGGKALRKKQS